MVITMKQVEDERGTVREFYRESAWVSMGLPSLGPWLQVNVTETKPGAVRGLHGEQMHKLVAVASGEAFGAYVDARHRLADVRPGGHGAADGRHAGARAERACATGSSRSATRRRSTCTASTTNGSRAWPATAVNPLDPALGITGRCRSTSDDRSIISEKDVTLPAVQDTLTDVIDLTDLDNFANGFPHDAVRRAAARDGRCSSTSRPSARPAARASGSSPGTPTCSRRPRTRPRSRRIAAVRAPAAAP